MVNNAQRTVKISAEAYRMLGHQSKEEKKSMGEIASEIICAALSPPIMSANLHGEAYDSTGKRIFF